MCHCKLIASDNNIADNIFSAFGNLQNTVKYYSENWLRAASISTGAKLYNVKHIRTKLSQWTLFSKLFFAP